MRIKARFARLSVLTLVRFKKEVRGMNMRLLFKHPRKSVGDRF